MIYLVVCTNVSTLHFNLLHYSVVSVYAIYFLINQFYFLMSYFFRNEEDTQEYLSTYQCPEDSQIIGQVLTLKWAGLVSSKRVLKLLDIMRYEFDN